MSLFNLRIPTVEKPTTPHPWAATIKDKHSSNIRHAHNSINNPNFPKEKKKRLAKERTTFTVIGDRLHKDFIYCAKFAKDLHKYRAEYYDAPVIRGVTSVEWSEVTKHLKNQYGGHAFCLSTPVAILINSSILGGIQEFKALISYRYYDHLSLDYYREGVFNFASYLRAAGRPCAYMHISIDGQHIGTLIFMLFADLVPYTCENFLRLCKEKKGGYSGTPVHRIVKDGWIQCGGFGLKNTALSCENFIIPFDRRGVLAMANDGRHIDCSTQFFVLLQPSSWMTHKYVAFGQLIEGVNTLKTIENVPTLYESPKSNIIISKAGILNMECHDIMINKNANEYIYGHIEDLIALGETIYEWVMDEVYKEIERRENPDLNPEEEESNQNVRETQRFLRKKEEIQSQYAGQPPAAITQAQEINNEFDVDEYAYEYEAEESQAKSDASLEPSLIVKPEKPYYIPLTDVPYPGEVDSTFDLKKFLKGDYCLESDLKKAKTSKTAQANKGFLSEMFKMDESISESESDESLDSDEERQISRYLKEFSDHVSFTGPVVRKIAKAYGMMQLVDSPRVLLTDEDIRKIRLASLELKQQENHETKVYIRSPSIGSEKHSRIKRRQTGFVRPQDLPKACRIARTSSEILRDDDDDDTSSIRKVRIVADSAQKDSNARSLSMPARRPTGFVRGRPVDDSSQEMRPSVLARLYKEMSKVAEDEPSPTLKEYSPIFSGPRKNFLLTHTSNTRIMHENAEKETDRHTSFNMDSSSYDRVFTFQHNRKIIRKISSDYVKTIDQIEHKKESTMRTIEYAKTRPFLTVSEYQMKNQKYREQKEMNDQTL